ncbi:MAG: DUF2164 domain-containing protein [Devosia sp.]
MKPIKFEKDERALLVGKIQRYFADELEQSIGTIPTERLLNFFTAEIGPFYYNQALSDAQAAMTRAVEGFNDLIYDLEQRPVRTK